MADVARDPFREDEGFQKLVLGTLDHAASCLEDGVEGPLLPFAMIVDEGERIVRHFPSPDYEQTLDGALAFADQGYEFWAVAWDGYITLEGRRTEAIFVRAGAKGRQESVLLAWRYERTVPANGLRKIGDPVFLGTAD